MAAVLEVLSLLLALSCSFLFFLVLSFFFVLSFIPSLTSSYRFSLAHFQSLQGIEPSVVKGSLLVLNFWATWAEPCKHLNEVFDELATKYPTAKFFKVSSCPLFPLLAGTSAGFLT